MMQCRQETAKQRLRGLKLTFFGWAFFGASAVRPLIVLLFSRGFLLVGALRERLLQGVVRMLGAGLFFFAFLPLLVPLFSIQCHILWKLQLLFRRL